MAVTTLLLAVVEEFFSNTVRMIPHLHATKLYAQINEAACALHREAEIMTQYSSVTFSDLPVQFLKLKFQ